MGPVARQVDYHQAHQAIQSILCCAYITTIIVISSLSFDFVTVFVFSPFMSFLQHKPDRGPRRLS
jgi:hypothetical protein